MIKTLDNGLRIIHQECDSPVVYCGYQIAAGTRHELPGEEGLAHFVEHATFKGTKRRKALQIIQSLERVGGELNAYTNKEETVFYAACLKENLPTALDILTDIVFHSVYPEQEVEKEKEVIVEEIESYNDSPAELIFDEFENILFENHPLGHNILGTIENVRRFTADDIRRFAARYYRPENAVLFVSGARGGIRGEAPTNLPHNGEAYKLAGDSQQKTQEAILSSFHSLKPPHYGGGLEGAPSLHEKHLGTHQAHVMMGSRAYQRNHPDRMALFLLNNILGGPGLSARLNVSLRERRGLVYTVESNMVAYSDTGVWSVYFGCDHEDTDRCIRLVKKELSRLVEKPLSARQLAQAKRQLKGQIGIAADHRENDILDTGKAFLHDGTVKSLARIYEEIDAITAEQLQRIATELFSPERMHTLIYR